VTARGRVEARYLVIAGNALMGGLAPAITRKIVPIGTYMVATEPLGDRMAEIISRDDAICDLNHALNYFRRTPDNRLLFGARVTYTGREPANLRAQMLQSVAHVFPQLASVRIDDCWGGLVDISVNRLPHIGRLNPRVYFAQGFSGHGVALTGMAGRVIAEAIAGTAERFDVFARIPHRDFPGGPLRIPVLAAARLWFRLLDLL
jgi:gamma-glutamylputrescine oxidase